MSYQDIPDEPEKVWTGDVCGACGYRIYVGETIFYINGNFYHKECLEDITAAELAGIMGEDAFEAEGCIPEPDMDEKIIDLK